MTANQIAYAQLQESKRANLVKEGQTDRQLAETERNNRFVSEEQARHNQAVEFETNRSNLVKEAETNRTNLANEALKAEQNLETRRHNVQTEKQAVADLAEKTRHNKVDEKTKQGEALVKAQQYAENVRHNKQTERIDEYTTNLTSIDKALDRETKDSQNIRDNRTSLLNNLLSSTLNLMGTKARADATVEASKNKSTQTTNSKTSKKKGK